MNAIGVKRGETRPQLLDVPDPEPAPNEALVRTLRVGVDGTDHEVIAGNHGAFPDGEDRIVLGHEAVGVVEDGGGTRFSAGDVVVPTVRRPTGEGNGYAARGELDMAPDGEYHERGIVGADGYMSEYFVSDAEYLLSIPESLAPLGFLVEPLSIAAKAVEVAAAARSSFTWEPESAAVLGNGSLGLLTLAFLKHAEGYDRLYCLGRRDRPDPTIDLVEALGATYVDSRETPVDELPDVRKREPERELDRKARTEQSGDEHRHRSQPRRQRGHVPDRSDPGGGRRVGAHSPAGWSAAVLYLLEAG